MILSSLETIKKISRNCIKVDSIDGNIALKRFTDKQYEVYNVNEALRIRSCCSAGACLDFYTDSEFIKFKYSVTGKSRDWAYFDIYIDNIFVNSIGQKPVVEPEGEFQYNIPGDKDIMKRLTIYLPHLVEITLRDIELSDHVHIEEVKPYEKSILCLGDSITQGMSALHPTSAYPVQLARYFSMNLLNQGVGGYFFNKESLDKTLCYSPDLITVAYGTNDWSKCKTEAEFSQNVMEFMDKLTGIYPKAVIFVITPIWRSDIDTEKDMGAFNCLADILIRVCDKYTQVKIIDGLTLVPHMPIFYRDANIHPSDEGFLHYALGLIGNITKYV